LIAEEMQKEKPKINVSKELSEFGWRYEGVKCYFTGKSPRITKETARAAHRKYVYSNEKIKKAIAFEFTPIKETVKNTVEFFRKNGNVK
jgi:nucleoside-diphosphate-sugar epimerase